MKRTHALLLTIVPLYSLVIGLPLALFSAHTANAAETVVIGNPAPSYIDPPVRHELPLNADLTTGYSYEAYAYDANGDDYYLLVCGSESISQDTYPATCGDTEICASEPTSSDTTAECTSSLPEEEQASWYVALCDTNHSAQSCSEIWNGTLPAEEQTLPFALPSTTIVSDITSTTAAPASIEEITYSLLLLFLLCSAVLAVPLLMLSVWDKNHTERLTVATSLFIIVFTAFLGLIGTWPEEAVIEETSSTVLGESTTEDTSRDKTPYPYVEENTGFYPVYLQSNVNSPILYRAAEDEELHVIERQEYWLKVYLPIGGIGWIPITSVK